MSIRLAFQTIVLLITCGIVAPGVAIAQSTIPAGAAVYIEPIDDLLDEHFRAELTRQQVALKVVASREEADVFIVGADQEKNLKLTPQGRGSISLRVRRDATVVVQDKATGARLWSSKWSVRSFQTKDLQKAAAGVVGRLKKAVRAPK